MKVSAHDRAQKIKTVALEENRFCDFSRAHRWSSETDSTDSTHLPKGKKKPFGLVKLQLTQFRAHMAHLHVEPIALTGIDAG